MLILKAWGSDSRAQRPLTTGIVRRQFPSLRGTTWRNSGRSTWNGLIALSTYAPFTWRLLTFMGCNLFCHVIIFRGLLSQCTQACALGIWLLVSHAPFSIGTTNPSRTGLKPLNQLWYIWVRIIQRARPQSKSGCTFIWNMWCCYRFESITIVQLEYWVGKYALLVVCVHQIQYVIETLQTQPVASLLKTLVLNPW